MIGDPHVEHVPIQEPAISIPVYFPNDGPIIPVETAFPTNQRMWIRARDGGRCQMPHFDDGEFIGFRNDPEDYVNVHHITAEYYYKQFHLLKWQHNAHHNPLNGITLSKDAHTMIHRDWMQDIETDYQSQPKRLQATMTLQAYAEWQTSQGVPAWVTRYDKYFLAVATINTYWHMHETGTFPFDECYSAEVERQYGLLMQSRPDFVEQYLALTR